MTIHPLAARLYLEISEHATYSTLFPCRSLALGTLLILQRQLKCRLLCGAHPALLVSPWRCADTLTSALLVTVKTAVYASVSAD